MINCQIMLCTLNVIPFNLPRAALEGVTHIIFRSSYGLYHECKLNCRLSPRCIFEISHVLFPLVAFGCFFPPFIFLNGQNVACRLKTSSWKICCSSSKLNNSLIGYNWKEHMISTCARKRTRSLIELPTAASFSFTNGYIWFSIFNAIAMYL